MKLLDAIGKLWRGDVGDPLVIDIPPAPKVDRSGPNAIPPASWYRTMEANQGARRIERLERAKTLLGEKWCLTKDKPLPPVRAAPVAVLPPVIDEMATVRKFRR